MAKRFQGCVQRWWPNPQGLICEQKRSRNLIVLRLRKELVTSLVSFFTLAVLCTSLAGPSASAALPGQDKAQPTGCAGTDHGSPLGNTEKPNVDFLCISGSSFGSFSGAFAVSSQAPEHFFKDRLFLIGLVPEGSSHKTTAVGDGSAVFSFIHPAQKVPTHLFNSVLTL